MLSALLTSCVEMLSSVILLLVISSLSCRGFDSEEFLNKNCQQTDFKYLDEKGNVYIDLFCQNFKFTFDEVEDIQHRDFIISNKTTIYIENAHIGTLNEKFFRKFPNALEMILRDVDMKMEFDLNTNDNKNLIPLKTLRLLHCQIHEQKETTALNSLQSLEMLEIRSTTSDNTEINENFFEGCPKLKKVSITNSEITNIGKDVFRKLPLLRYLDLSDLSLSGESLSPYALVNNKNLEFLDLSLNKFKDILSLPESIKYLNFSENRISKISRSDLQNMPLLEEVSLDGNDLEDIPEDSFDGLQNLETLTLVNNQIRQISEETFKNLPKLKYLNLQWNLIEKSPTLSGIENFKFEPQKEGVVTTTTEESSSSTEESSSSTTDKSSTTTNRPNSTISTTTNAPHAGASASSVMNLFLIGFCIFLFI